MSGYPPGSGYPYGAPPAQSSPYGASQPYGAPPAGPYGGGGGPQPSAPYGPPAGEKPSKVQQGGYPHQPPSGGGYQQPPSGGGYQPSAPPAGAYGNPFAALVPSAFPPGADPNVVACFQAADRDGSGFIDDKELQHALSSYNQTFSMRTVHLLMYLFTSTNVRKIGI